MIYPVFESVIWGQNSSGLQSFFETTFGAPFHDFAGSVVVHSMGGWLASLFAYESAARLNKLVLVASGGAMPRQLKSMVEFQPPRHRLDKARCQ